VTLNGHPLSEKILRTHCVMCEQYDVHNAFLTCRETLEFAAKFYSVDPDAAMPRVESIIDAFGLRDCQDTRVGNEFIKGLTGGQKKRLSLAVAMVKSPTVIFMDEPTTGLDAAGALAITKFILKMAKDFNMLVVTTIHAPSTTIFSSFEKAMVLSAGKVCYCGATSELAAFCEDAGKPILAQGNPADVFLEMVNSEFTDKEEVAKVVEAWQQRQPEVGVPEQRELPAPDPRPSFCTNLGTTFSRTLR
jgi:ABC-type multidrug transport system ATPase subunit